VLLRCDKPRLVLMFICVLVCPSHGDALMWLFITFMTRVPITKLFAGLLLFVTTVPITKPRQFGAWGQGCVLSQDISDSELLCITALPIIKLFAWGEGNSRGLGAPNARSSLVGRGTRN